MKHTFYITLGLAMASLPVFARKNQDSTAVADSIARVGKLSVSGYVDTYYFKNLNNPLSGGNASNSGFERIFDQKEGQFQLGLAQTRFAYTNNKAEAVLDITFGPNADMGNYGNVLSLNTSNPTSTALAIKQAYFTYKLTNKFSMTAGQFGTHIGYEVIDAPVNYNYSLSNLFGNGPFYHLGVKGTYAFSDRVSLMGGVVNNWDMIYDNNKYKSVISQLFLNPAEGWNVYVNWIGGYEDNAPYDSNGVMLTNTKFTTKSLKHMFDLTTGYQVSDNFYLGFNGAIGFLTKQGTNANQTNNWGGAALYSNYKFTDMFGIGVRAEYFDNTSAITGLTNKNMALGTDVTSITVTPNITINDGHLLLKPEFRMDAYKKTGITGGEQLEDKDGAFTKTSQVTIGLAAIYKF